MGQGIREVYSVLFFFRRGNAQKRQNIMDGEGRDAWSKIGLSQTATFPTRYTR